MLWHITTFWGRAKRLGCPCSTVRKFRHRVSVVRTSLESAWPCFRALCFVKIRLWKPLNSWSICQRCWTSCAALHLTLDTKPIAGFHPTGTPSENLPSNNIKSLTLLDLPVTHMQHSQQHRLQHVSFPQSIFWRHQRKNDHDSQIKTLIRLLMRNNIVTPCNWIQAHVEDCARRIIHVLK